MALPEILIGLDIPQDCLDEKTSAREKGRRFVIHRRPGDIVWRVEVDGCWLTGSDNKKVDYLFWGANSKKRLSLVELKGSNFGQALKQIEETLAYLYQLKPDLRRFAAQGGICAYVVLSNSHSVPQNLNKRARIQKKYGVIIQHTSQRFECQGVDDLC